MELPQSTFLLKMESGDFDMRATNEKPGLDNVIAANTVLSHVDGEAGRLIIRGHDVEDLAARLTFEEATAILWQGYVPIADDAKRLASRLGAARAKAYARFLPLAPHL